MHATPAGLPLGIPGIGELIEISTQQAPQQLQVKGLFNIYAFQIGLKLSD